MITIEIIKNKIFTDKKLWGKKWKNEYIGEQIINILFYLNKDGNNDFILMVNGKNETADFKSQLKNRYKDIPNTELRDRFFKYAKIN